VEGAGTHSHGHHDKRGGRHSKDSLILGLDFSLVNVGEKLKVA
jgi:hypothetical protein